MRATIDGRPVESAGPVTILELARKIGVPIPTLCHDDRLAPAGACRLCLVGITGRTRWAPACATDVEDGMDITVENPALRDYRTQVLGMLARRYPADPVHRFPDLGFHRLLFEHGLTPVGADSLPADVDESHPYLRFDPTRCVQCFRCVRICDEVEGRQVWRVEQRGSDTRVAPAGGRLFPSPCVACGACADTCPTGAISDRIVHEAGPAEAWTRTVCPYCGTGCEMEAGVKDGKLVAVRPRRDAPVNRGHLCSKGRYAWGAGTAPDRAVTPMVREHGVLRPASWEEALARAAGELTRALAYGGPGSVGVVASSRNTNEENYLTQKFARVVLGTNNVDSCARVCHTPTAAAMKLTLGTGAATNSFADLDLARTILVFGANPTAAHPVVGARIRRRVRDGARLIVADPRRTELARMAEIHLALKPGTNVPLLNAMASVIAGEGLADEEFLAARVDGVAAFLKSIKDWTPERAEAVCGVPADLIRRAARIYATSKPAYCAHGLGVTEHLQGTEGVMALASLALLTGNIGVPGSGVNPLRGQNNVQGAAHMGCDPGILAGAVPVTEGRESFARMWGSRIPVEPGLHLTAMLDAAAAGQVTALWVIGYDPLPTYANTAATRKALEGLDSLIMQDLFVNETAKAYATVFFPAATSFERDGTFMNAERRVQRIRKAVEPPGEAKPDWEIIQRLAGAMGHPNGFAFESPAAIWDEIREVWPAAAGMTWDRLDSNGLQWPCPDTGHPGTAILHTQSFPGGKATLRPLTYRRSTEQTDAGHPLILITGRTLHQFNAGTMTRRTGHMILRPADTLDVSPEDAERLGLHDGGRARVISRHGETELPVRITEDMKPGEVFASFHMAESAVNNLTSLVRDRFVGTPEYKIAAVRVERLADPG